ncbi:unnamed protein product [Closterium sp. Naga37s-1]|nr:unnamed protein product [Closterium sp. Naga37s-1]
MSRSYANLLDLSGDAPLFTRPVARGSKGSLTRSATATGTIADGGRPGAGNLMGLGGGVDEASSSGSESPSSLAQERLIIVANMLPLHAERDAATQVRRGEALAEWGASGRGGRAGEGAGEAQEWAFRWDEDALLLQMKDGITAGSDEDMEIIYIGSLKVEVDASEQDRVAATLLENFNCVPTFLPADLKARFYHGFCKQQLWPLFHYLLPLGPSHSSGLFDRELWQAYVSANKIFSDKVMEVISPDDDYVWVHDYHLMVLPTFLRKRFHRVRLGFFLHSPFPSSEIYRTLPVRDEILRALLNADLIGFHTFDYARHFLSCCSRMLGLEYESKRGHIGLDYYGRTVGIKIMPVGIHMGRLNAALSLADTEWRVGELRAQFEGKKIVLGVDDMDLFKGIGLKMLAMEQLLRQHPEWVGKVVLVQIANPARGRGAEVEHMQNDIYSIVKRVNREFGREGYEPVMLLERHVPMYERAAFMSQAECLVVTAVRDGMNLTPYEYIVCRHGVDAAQAASAAASAAARASPAAASAAAALGPGAAAAAAAGATGVVSSAAAGSAGTGAHEGSGAKPPLPSHRSHAHSSLDPPAQAPAAAAAADVGGDEAKHTETAGAAEGGAAAAAEGGAAAVDAASDGMPTLSAAESGAAAPASGAAGDIAGAPASTEAAGGGAAGTAAAAGAESAGGLVVAPAPSLPAIITKRGGEAESRKKRRSAIVVSEFIGCSPSLSGAIRINPWNVQAVADAVNSALTMGESEQEMRHDKHYKYVRDHHVGYWAHSFVSDLQRTCREHSHLCCYGIGFGLGFRTVALDPNFRKLQTDLLVRSYQRAQSRLILLDYDGTMMPQTSINKTPGQDVLDVVQRLSSDPRNTVFVVSGRRRENLEAWFHCCPRLGLAAEHGFFVSWSRSAPWQTTIAQQDATWKDAALPVLELYTESTDGSYIETKESALVWHHRDADPDFGSWQAKELLDHLESVLANEPVVVKGGHHIVEIKPQGVSKGLVVDQLLRASKGAGKAAPDFVLCVGDDRSDEDMFERISALITAAPSPTPLAEVFACTVGQKPSKARYYLDDTSEVIKMLRGLANAPSMPSSVPPPLSASSAAPQMLTPQHQPSHAATATLLGPQPGLYTLGATGGPASVVGAPGSMLGGMMGGVMGGPMMGGLPGGGVGGGVMGGLGGALPPADNAHLNFGVDESEGL